MIHPFEGERHILAVDIFGFPKDVATSLYGVVVTTRILYVRFIPDMGLINHKN